jgi:hypothetical protein
MDVGANGQNTERSMTLRESLNQAKKNVHAANQPKPRVLAGSISSRMQIDPHSIESTLASSLENEESARNSKNKLTFPMTAEDALNTLSPYLLDYERKELQSGEFDTVYFFPLNERKRMGPGSDFTRDADSKMNNYGFDMENQEYNVKMNEHIAY